MTWHSSKLVIRFVIRSDLIQTTGSSIESLMITNPFPNFHSPIRLSGCPGVGPPESSETHTSIHTPSKVTIGSSFFMSGGKKFQRRLGYRYPPTDMDPKDTFECQWSFHRWHRSSSPHITSLTPQTLSTVFFNHQVKESVETTSCSKMDDLRRGSFFF